MIGTMIGSGLSRLWNVLRYRGHWHTTTSARVYREAWLADMSARAAWRQRMARIDALFQRLDPEPSRQPHCEWAALEREREAMSWMNDMGLIRDLQSERERRRD